jgi:hypothetical protein
MAGTRGGNRNIFGRIDFGIPTCSMALTPGNHCSLSYNLVLKNLKCSAPFYEAPIRHESCQTTVGVVFSTWTCVCFSGGGAVRESQPSLQHALVPQSHTLCCERQGGMAVGGCTPVLARHAGTARRTLSTRGTAGKRPGYRRPAPQAAPGRQSDHRGPWASSVGC